jgi:hypothetical protein
LARSRPMELRFSNGVEPPSSRRKALTNTRAKVVALAFSGLVLLGMSSLRASARIVCNEDGDCWHAPDDYAYPPALSVPYRQFDVPIVAESEEDPV